jgi:putative SOS response-associated peptidase YedK
MLKIHTRMPAMLHPDDFEAWLDGAAGKEVLMRPPPELQEWIVDRSMNKTGVGDDDPATTAPVECEASAVTERPMQGA